MIASLFIGCLLMQTLPVDKDKVMFILLNQFLSLTTESLVSINQ